MVTDMPPRDLRQAIGLVFASGGLLRGDATPVTPSQGFPYGHYGRFTITFQYQGILSSPWVPPGLQFLVHILYQPAIVPLDSYSLMGHCPHILVASGLIHHGHHKVI